MIKEVNGENVLVDCSGRVAPKMPEGWVAVLRDDEWVARLAEGWEQAEIEEINIKDMVAVLSHLFKLYPNRYKGMSEGDIKSTALAWLSKLEHQDRKLVMKAFKHCTDIMSQPPVPADILKTITKIKNGTL